MADRNKPTPERAMEVLALLARLRPMAKRSARGQGETLTITLTVPAESATLAAWMETKAAMRSGHGLEADCRHMAMTAATADDDPDLDRARQYFERALWNAVGRDWARLDHPILFPSPALPPHVDGGGEPIKDDIPF